MKITGYIILIGGILVSLYDVYAVLNGYSVSHFMTTVFTEYPTVTFTIGFICGHWLGSVIYKQNG